jgi:hypothetical protein
MNNWLTIEKRLESDRETIVEQWLNNREAFGKQWEREGKGYRVQSGGTVHGKA